MLDPTEHPTLLQTLPLLKISGLLLKESNHFFLVILLCQFNIKCFKTCSVDHNEINTRWWHTFVKTFEAEASRESV